MTVIAVFNQKGGVGKTTTCFNLAHGLMRIGQSPLAIDLDAQANLSLCGDLRAAGGQETVLSYFRDDRNLGELVRVGAGGLSMIPGHMELSKVDMLFGGRKELSVKLRDGLRAEFAQHAGTILIDCCPSFGVLSLNAIIAADHLLIPVSADYLGLDAMRRMDSAVAVLERAMRKPIARRIVITRFDQRRRLAHEVVQSLRGLYGETVCRTLIRETVPLAEAPQQHRSIFEHAPASQGAQDYRALTEELVAARFAA